MAKIWTGPVGRVVTGHVLDVSVKPFTEALKFYDPQLYVYWNANKLKGHGCWQIRRKPTQNSVVEVVTYQGNTLVRLEPAENDILHQVLDCAFLNYDQLRKIKEMDTWNKKHWIHDLEYREKKGREERAIKAREAMKYAAKQFKKEIRDFKEYVASGNNPHQVLKEWDKS